MTPREIRIAQAHILDAPPPQQPQAARLVVAQATEDLTRIDRDKSCVEREFDAAARARGIEAPCGERLTPHRLTEDNAHARHYLLAAWLALAGEMAISAWMFQNRGASAVAGGVFALVTTVLLERAVHFTVTAADGKDRPARVSRLLKRVVFYPAVACFLLAVVTVFGARTVEGALAASDPVLALVAAGLFAFTVALVLLSATFANIAFNYKWSARLAGRYEALIAEERATRAFLRELTSTYRAEDQAPATAVTVQPVIRSDVPSMGAALGILAVAGLIAGCSPVHGPNTNTAEGAAALSAGGVDRSACHAVVDVSGSVRGLHAVWQHLRSELPEFVVRQNCAQLTVSRFSVDGWDWETLERVAIPSAPLPSARVVPTELKGTTFEAALRQDAVQRQVVALDDHRQQVARALQGLQRLDTLFETVPGAASSDPLGVLKRIAASGGGRPQVYLVVTDMADSRFPAALPPIATPQDEVHVVVMLQPERTTQPHGQVVAQTGAEQFERRSAMLREAAPWVHVAPAFAADVWRVLNR